MKQDLEAQLSQNQLTCNDSQVLEYENSCFLLCAPEFEGGLLHSFIVAIANRYTSARQNVTPGCKVLGKVEGKTKWRNSKGAVW